jgi:hypothetical protein
MSFPKNSNTTFTLDWTRLCHKKKRLEITE